MAAYFKYVLLTGALLSGMVGRAQPYTNLVLKGGGVRGIAYAGALKVLEEQRVMDGISKVAGTSVGALTGALVCLGYNAREIEELMMELDIATFNDGEWYFVGGQQRLRKYYGWYKGKELEEWAGKRIKNRTGSDRLTFRQLHDLVLKNKGTGTYM